MGKLSFAIPTPLGEFSFISTFRNDRTTLLELTRLRHALAHGSAEELPEVAHDYYTQLLAFYRSVRLRNESQDTTILPTQFSWEVPTLIDDFSTSVPRRFTDSSLLFELSCAALCFIATQQHIGGVDALDSAQKCARQMRTELLPGFTPRVFCCDTSTSTSTLAERLRSGESLDAEMKNLPREPHVFSRLFYQTLEYALEGERKFVLVRSRLAQLSLLQRVGCLSQASRCYEQALQLLPESALLQKKYHRCQSFVYRFLAKALVEELSEAGIAVACALEAVQWAGSDAESFRADLKTIQHQNNLVYANQPIPERSAIQLQFDAADCNFHVQQDNGRVCIHIPVE